MIVMSIYLQQFEEMEGRFVSGVLCAPRTVETKSIIVEYQIP